MKNDAIENSAVQKSEFNGTNVTRLTTTVGLYIRVAVIMSSYLLFYAADLPDLANDWFNYYGPFSYCAVIPIMSLYFVWKERRTLAKIPVEPGLLGVVFVLGAGTVGLVGKAIGDSFTVRVSMVLTVGALIYLLLGRRFFKALRFPIAFLFLMIPWPYVLVKEVAYHLRIIDAVLAEVALRALGVLVYRDSYFLHLPNITLEVADLCSGISSVFALFALGSFYAYFLPLRAWQKLLVVGSTVPFAALINLLRIILTSALAYYIGPVALSYLVHELTGIITFFIALGLFIGLSELLQRRGRGAGRVVSLRVGIASEKETSPSVGIVPPATGGYRSGLAFSAACAALLLGVFLSVRVEGSQPISLSRDLTELPMQIGDYQSVKGGWSQPYQDSNAEQELSRYYVNGTREAFEVYVGYRSHQRGEKRLRSPKLTMVRHWNFVSLDPAQIPIAHAAAIDGVWMAVQKDNAKQLVLYWYQDGGETFAGEVAYRFHQAKRMMLDKRTDGAVVRIATPIADGEDIERVQERLARFSSQLYPELTRVLPR